MLLLMADKNAKGGGRQRWQQVETEAAAGADNNQPESGSDSSGRNGDCGGNGDGGNGGTDSG